MTKFFKKSKKPILEPFEALYIQIWAKMNFPEKRTLSVFKHSNYLPLCQKSEKNYCAIPEKNVKLMDRQMNK